VKAAKPAAKKARLRSGLLCLHFLVARCAAVCTVAVFGDFATCTIAKTRAFFSPPWRPYSPSWPRNLHQSLFGAA